MYIQNSINGQVVNQNDLNSSFDELLQRYDFVSDIVPCVYYGCNISSISGLSIHLTSGQGRQSDVHISFINSGARLQLRFSADAATLVIPPNTSGHIVVNSNINSIAAGAYSYHTTDTLQFVTSLTSTFPTGTLVGQTLIGNVSSTSSGVTVNYTNVKRFDFGLLTKPFTVNPSTPTISVQPKVSRTAKEFVTNIDGNGLQNTAIITDEDLAALGLAKLASPVFTGDPEAPTRAFGDSTNSIATTAFITNNTIRQRGALGTTVDLNSITEIGVHYQSTNSSAASGHNYPVAKAGVLTVSTAGSTAIVTQIYQEYNTGIIWSRSAFNGVWSIWSQLATIGQLNAIGYGITHQNTTANHEWVEFANGYISGNMAIDLPGSMATSGSHNVIFDKPLVSRCSGVQVSCVSDVGVVVTVGSLTNSGVTIYWHSPIPIGGSIKTYLSYTGF